MWSFFALLGFKWLGIPLPLSSLTTRFLTARPGEDTNIAPVNSSCQEHWSAVCRGLCRHGYVPACASYLRLVCGNNCGTAPGITWTSRLVEYALLLRSAAGYTSLLCVVRGFWPQQQRPTRGGTTIVLDVFGPSHVPPYDATWQYPIHHCHF